MRKLVASFLILLASVMVVQGYTRAFITHRTAVQVVDPRDALIGYSVHPVGLLQGSTIEAKVLTIYNRFDRPVTIRVKAYGGHVHEPLRIAGPQSMAPGGEMPVLVVLDGSKLSPGEITVTYEIEAYAGDRRAHVNTQGTLSVTPAPTPTAMDGLPP